jgi:TolB-like protein
MRILKSILFIGILVSNLNAFDLFNSNVQKQRNNNTGKEQSMYQMQMYDTENVAGRINNITRFLTDQLTQNKNFYKVSEPIIAITSLVYQTDYDRTNKLGNIIAENMIHEMQVRGYRVLDYKVMPVIKITKHGDFAISRNIEKLKKKHLINYVLTGTIIEMYNGMVLNVRIVDLASNLVLSSAQAFIDKKTYFMTVKDVNGRKDSDSKNSQQEKPKSTDWITPLLDK